MFYKKEAIFCLISRTSKYKIINFPWKSEGPLKNDVTERSACHRPRGDKIFPDKLSGKVYSGFNIVYVYYTIPHTRPPLPRG